MSTKQIKVYLSFSDFLSGGDIKYSIENRFFNIGTSLDSFQCPKCSEMFEFSFEVIPELKFETSEATSICETDTCGIEVLEEHIDEVAESKYNSKEVKNEIPEFETLFVASTKEDVSVPSPEFKMNDLETSDIDDTPSVENILNSSKSGETLTVENSKVQLKQKAKVPIQPENENIDSNMKKLERMMKCSVCEAVLSSKARYEDHVRKKHPDEAEQLNISTEPFSCSLCDKQFKCRQFYLEHIAVHKNPQRLTCKECGKEFSFASNLSRHMFTVHMGIRRFICDVCGSSYTQSSTLKEHKMVKHQGIIPDHRQKQLNKLRHSTWRPPHKKSQDVKQELTVECDLCSGLFKNNHSLELHKVRKHQESLPIECKMCEKRFITEMALGLHMTRKHGQTLTVTCNICDKQFSSTRLPKHITEMHKKADEKPHKCQYCEKAFRQKTAKDIHEAIHTGENKLACYDPKCTIRFHDPGKRYGHIKKCHPDIFELRERRKRYDGSS